jgi:hypothetical protein
MKKLLTAAMLLASPAAFAINLSNTTVWSCAAPAGGFLTNPALAYCNSPVINSATTPATLGAISVDPAKQVFVSLRGDSGLNNLVSATLTLSLGGNQVGVQTVSVTTNGNLINLGAVPYFDAVTVSFTNLISATNTVRATVIENR